MTRKFRLLSLFIPALAVVAACLPAARVQGPLPAGGKHVLFIGNSLTYVNDLPRTVEQVALLAGDTIRTSSVAKPDYALLDHLADGEVQKVLAREHWDVVAMQQGSSALAEGRDWLYRGVDQLAPMIRAAGGVPALYEVWPLQSRSFDFAGVRESYLTAAQRVNGIFLPAGSAWLEAWKLDGSLSLYAADGLHPSPTGTYLAALVIVARVTGKDVRTLPATAYAGGGTLAIPEATVRKLQVAAMAAVASSARR